MKITDLPVGSSFLSCPTEPDLAKVEADFAILGIPFGVPYDIRGLAGGASLAPQAVRERSSRYGAFWHHYDFDTGGAMLPRDLRVIDVGDVVASPTDLAGNAARATEAVRTLNRKTVPIVLGGDDSTPTLAVRAFDEQGPVTVVQVDAHIDYRDEVRGQRYGYSSPMRRAAEMPWIDKIVHVGIRGVGSARREDVDDTRANGNAIVTAREVHASGIEAAVRHVPAGGRYYVHIDVDGFDPSVMPGTSAAAPGGLSYQHGLDLIQGLQERGGIVGLGFAEFHPTLDINGITALGVVRLIVAAMAVARPSSSSVERGRPPER